MLTLKLTPVLAKYDWLFPSYTKSETSIFTHILGINFRSLGIQSKSVSVLPEDTEGKSQNTRFWRAFHSLLDVTMVNVYYSFYPI